ncbi:MAG: HPr family phosphocarrier protein [Desulfobacteraceae bacterium A6]|nr:MAG: HPr family phosphocarrier protein [Desulfobacteraceae bacterium A6]
MNKGSCSLLKSVIIKNELGLHARAAAKIATLAGRAKDKIWLIKDGEKVDASSIIDILSLGCSKGTEITLAADSKTDFDLLRNIIIMAENGFGE